MLERFLDGVLFVANEMLRGRFLLLAAVAFGLALAGAAEASSPTERRIQELFWAISIFTVAVSIFTFGILFWFLYRYRESASPRRTEHLVHHRTLEVVWTIVPPSSWR